MSLTHPLVARVTMLIHRPVAEVFNAFVDPSITTKFWFNRSSDKLATGRAVTWFWDHYGVSADISVKVVETNKRILIEWPTPVEWVFTSMTTTTTFVSITASGFTGDDDARVSQALDSTEGFNLVIAACKALLEHGILLNTVLDKDPRFGPSSVA